MTSHRVLTEGVSRLPTPWWAVAGLIAAWPAGAWAQAGVAARPPAAAASEPTSGLEQVIVTAEKRRADSQKTALAVQTFAGDALAREGKNRIDEVMEGLAGVQVQNSPTGAVFSIRGFDGGNAGATGSSNATSDVSGNPGVAVIIDGVYQTRAEALRAGMVDVARVEVMRGTQSTTLGGNSLVGAVSLVSHQPVFERFGRASVELGNYNRQSFTGVLNTPLAEDHALRLAFQSSRRDGYTSSNGDNEDTQLLRVKYRWNPRDDLNLVLTAERSTIGGVGLNQGSLLYQGYWVPATPATLLPSSAYPAGTTVTGQGCISPPRNSATPQTYATLGCAPTYLFNTTAGGAVNYRDRPDPWNDGLPANAYQNNPHTANTLTTWAALLEWDLGFGQLNLSPSLQTTRRENVGRVQGPTTSLSVLDQRTTQLDARLVSSERDKTWKWLAGLSYLDTKGSAATGFELYPGSGVGSVVAAKGATPATYNCPLSASGSGNANCYAWTYTPSVTQQTSSLYGNSTLTLLPALRLLAGARYQADKKGVTSSVFSYRGGNVTGPDGIDFALPGEGTASWNKLTYRIGAEYDLTPSAMAYLTYATGYQPGQVSFDTAQVASPKVFVGAEETLKQLALGLKSRWFDNRLQFNAEAFSSRFKNYALNSGTVVTGLSATTGQGTGTCAHPSGTPLGTPATYNAATGVFCAQDTPMPNLSGDGVDIDVAWAFSPADRLTLAAEWLHTTITSASSSSLTVQKIIDSISSRGGSISAAQAAALYAQVSAGEQSMVGYRPSNSPKFSTNFSYQHRFALADASSLVARAQVVYKTSYWTSGQGSSLPLTAIAPAVQPAYTLVHAYLSWTSADGRIDVSGYVRNLGNRVVLNNLNTGPQPWWTVTLGAPRTYGLTTSVKF